MLAFLTIIQKVHKSFSLQDEERAHLRPLTPEHTTQPGFCSGTEVPPEPSALEPKSTLLFVLNAGEPPQVLVCSQKSQNQNLPGNVFTRAPNQVWTAERARCDEPTANARLSPLF